MEISFYLKPHQIKADRLTEVSCLLSRWRHGDKQKFSTSILQDLVDDGDEDKPPHVIVIDQLFAFIGSNPEKAVS